MRSWYLLGSHGETKPLDILRKRKYVAINSKKKPPRQKMNSHLNFTTPWFPQAWKKPDANSPKEAKKKQLKEPILQKLFGIYLKCFWLSTLCMQNVPSKVQKFRKSPK